MKRLDLSSCDDWRVGDLAECVIDCGWIDSGVDQPTSGPLRGSVWRVTEISVADHWGEPVLALHLAGWAHRFGQVGFRKLRPTADIGIAADATFTAALKHRSIEHIA